MMMQVMQVVCCQHVVVILVVVVVVVLVAFNVSHISLNVQEIYSPLYLIVVAVDG